MEVARHGLRQDANHDSARTSSRPDCAPEDAEEARQAADGRDHSRDGGGASRAPDLPTSRQPELDLPDAHWAARGWDDCPSSVGSDQAPDDRGRNPSVHATLAASHLRDPQLRERKVDHVGVPAARAQERKADIRHLRPRPAERRRGPLLPADSWWRRQPPPRRHQSYTPTGQEVSK